MYGNLDITYCSNTKCKNKQCKRNQIHLNAAYYCFRKANGNPISIAEFKDCKERED